MGENQKVVCAEFSYFNIVAFAINVIASLHLELKTRPTFSPVSFCGPRIGSICVASPKVTKASKATVTVADIFHKKLGQCKYCIRLTRMLPLLLPLEHTKLKLILRKATTLMKCTTHRKSHLAIADIIFTSSKTESEREKNVGKI